MSYAREKFGVAVSNLATGTGTIQERIWDAYMSFHPVKVEDFPDDLKAEYLEIYDALTVENESYNEKGEVTTGKVQNTLAKMSNADASELAQKIVDMDHMLRYEK